MELGSMADPSKDEAGDGQPRPAQALSTNSPHIVEIIGGNGGGNVAGGSPNPRGGVSFKTNQSAMASFKNYPRPPSLGGMQRTSYYSNHYNRRLDSFMEIRFKTKAEILWQLRLEGILFRKEWKWVVFLLAAEYFNLIMHNFIYWVQGHFWKGNPPPPLDDLGIMLLGGRFPESGRWMVGLFLYFLIAMVLALCLGRLLLNNVPWGCPQTEMVKLREDGMDVRTVHIPVPFAYIIKHLGQVLGMQLILRVFCYMMTLVPNPAYYCHPPYWDPPNSVGEIMGRIEVVGSCGDLLFSSHTTHAMVMTMTVFRHAPGVYAVCVIAAASMFMVPISLLAYKDHYSHDIIVSLYTSVMLWMLTPEAKTANCDELGIELPPDEHWGKR